MCKRCGGTLYIETDHWGTHQTCWRCGASEVIKVNIVPDLWSESCADEGPGGPRGDNLSRPYGKVIPRK